MVTFEGDAGCIAGIPKSIDVVLDGDETNEFPAQQRESDLWIGEWRRQPATKNFDAEGRTVSVRTGVNRTDCRRSSAAKDPSPQVHDGWVASVTFHCYRQAVRQVTVQAKPDVPISYVRRMNKVGKDDDSRECVEHKNFVDSPIEIKDVWFDTDQVRHESLSLQVRSEEASLEAPGLLVNHPSVMKYMKGGEGILDLETLLIALGEQRAEGLQSQPPLFASSAYDKDFKRLSMLRDDQTTQIRPEQTREVIRTQKELKQEKRNQRKLKVTLRAK